MREPKVAKGEPPQQPICVLNIVLPETIIKDAMQKKLKGMSLKYFLMQRKNTQNRLYIPRIYDKIIAHKNFNFIIAISKLFIYFILRSNNL